MYDEEILDITLESAALEFGIDCYNEGSVPFSLRTFLMALKNMATHKQYDYESLRNGFLPKLVSKCKTVEEVKYLKKDKSSVKGQLTALLRRVEDHEKGYESSLSNSYKKQVDKGNLTSKKIKDHIKFIETDYTRMLNEKEKELKAKQ